MLPAKRPTALVRAVPVALGAAVLVWTFGEIDVARVRELFTSASLAILPLVLLPQIASLALETAGWRQAFAVLGRRVPYLRLLRVRLATEALAQTLPAGVVLSESMKPALLGRFCDVPASEGVAGVAARKYLLLVSQSIYLAIMTLLGWSTLQGTSASVLGRSGLEWLVLSCAGGALFAAVAARSLLMHGAVARHLLELLLRLPSRRLRQFLSEKAARFHETDGEVKRYFAAGLFLSSAPAAWCLGGWLLESLETFLILRLLGVELDFTTVAAFEVALSFLRSVAFVLPAGLGLQDAGYVAFLCALGVPDALSVGAAFVLVKRSKEAFWACVGYGLLALTRRPAPDREHALSPRFAPPVRSRTVEV